MKNYFLYILFLLLLFFAPLSFAATEPWAILMLQGAVAAVFWVFILRAKDVVLTFPLKMLLGAIGFIILIGAAQALTQADGMGGARWLPFTMCRVYTLESALMLLFYAAAAFSAAQLFDRTSRVKVFCLGAILAGLVVLVTAIGFSRGEYIAFLAKIAPARESMGPFLNRNHGGMFLAMTFFISLGYTCAGFFDKAKFLAAGRKAEFYIRQTVFILLSAALMFGVFYSRSRGALVSLGAVFFLFLLFYLSVSPFSKAKKAFFISCTLGVFLIAGFLAFKNYNSLSKLARRSSAVADTVRKDIYSGAYCMLKEHSFTGVGLGAFSVGIMPYIGAPTAFPQHLHNDWLELALGIGSPAAGIVSVLLLALCAALIMRFIMLKKEKQLLFLGLCCALAVMCAGSLVDFHFYIPANAFLFFCICGLLCSAAYNENTAKTARPAGVVKICACIILLLALYPFTMKTAAWRAFLFGKGMTTESKIAFYQKGLDAYPDPLYALRAANACLAASRDNSLSEEKRLLYKECARDISGRYLRKYPLMGGFNTIYNQIL